MGWPGPMTHRQFMAWQFWEAEQWNQPSRSDYYAMLIANRVDHVLAEKKDSNLEPYVIPFGSTGFVRVGDTTPQRRKKGKRRKPADEKRGIELMASMTREEAEARTKAAKGRWGRYLGMDPKKAKSGQGFNIQTVKENPGNPFSKYMGFTKSNGDE